MLKESHQEIKVEVYGRKLQPSYEKYVAHFNSHLSKDDLYFTQSDISTFDVAEYAHYLNNTHCKNHIKFI